MLYYVLIFTRTHLFGNDNNDRSKNKVKNHSVFNYELGLIEFIREIYVIFEYRIKIQVN